MFVVQTLTFRQFAELCGRLGAGELGREEKYKNNESRVRSRAELVPRLSEILGQKTNSEWCHLFEER